MGVPRLLRLALMAAMLMTGAARAQVQDIDEHGRPSRLPVQANFWAAQAAANTKPADRQNAKPATAEKPKAGERTACATERSAQDKPPKTGPAPCPAAE